MYYIIIPREEIPSKKRGPKPKYGDDMIYLYLEPLLEGMPSLPVSME